MHEVFLIWGKQQQSCLLLMLQLVREALGSGQLLSVILLDKSCPFLNTYDLWERWSWITHRMVGSSKCNFLDSTFIVFQAFLSIRLTNAGISIMLYPCQCQFMSKKMLNQISQGLIHPLFYRWMTGASFKNSVISISECSSVNESMTAYLFISSVSQISDMFTLKGRISNRDVQGGISHIMSVFKYLQHPECRM